MLSAPKSIAILLTTAILGLSAVAVTAAQTTRFVTPSKAMIRIRNITCPGTAEMKITVWSRKAGKVKVTLMQRGKGDLGTDVIVADTKRKGLYKGIQVGTVELARTGQNARYRVIAGEGRKSTKSRWVSVPSCEVVT